MVRRDRALVWRVGRFRVVCGVAGFLGGRTVLAGSTVDVGVIV